MQDPERAGRGDGPLEVVEISVNRRQVAVSGPDARASYSFTRPSRSTCIWTARSAVWKVW